ncbi:MAG: TrkH family potassium uptake protein [Bacteroidales bacterium]|nr:TrkH family potassium uptake protein [Bacteroidales bacterium]
MATVNNINIRFVENNLRHIRRFNFRLVARLLGLMLIIMGLSMAFPILVSILYQDGSQYDLTISALLILMVGLLMRNFIGRNCNYELHEKESFWITSVVWIFVPLMGALPFLFTGSLSTFTDACFESFSGFTTTGSSVLSDLERVPKGLLLWRGMTQWIGGLGLILFLIALFRKLSVGSTQLYDAEFSGTVQRKLHPRISTSVQLMWMIYVGMTLLLWGLLMMSGIDFFDSVCTTLATVSTGGFMVHDNGVSSFPQSALVCLTLFMFLSGVNIAIIYRLVAGKPKEMWHNEEFRVYLVVFFIAVVSLSVAFYVQENGLLASINYAFFHVASTISTCGLSIPSPNNWPRIASAITFVLIIIGASAGSTGGALKIKRVMILVKYVRNYFTRMLHPHAVFSVTIDDTRISDDYINKIFGFVFMYVMFIVGGGFVLTICGLDIPTAVCVSAANIANLGPSPLIDVLGANFDYVTLVPLAKWTLIVLMLVGRIEIFAIIALFSPAYWRS